MNQILTWLTSLKKECPVCGGEGMIACSCDEKGEIACPNCGGKGVVPRQVTTTQKIEMPCDNPQCQKGKVVCQSCHGTGKTATGEVCAVCGGKGQTDCPVCGGIGRVERVKQESWMEHTLCHVCNGRGLVDCYLCHGTKERTCPTCKGTGKVLDKGKLAVLVAGAVLLAAMPVLAIALTAVLLGGAAFVLYKRSAEARQAAESAGAAEPGTEAADATNAADMAKPGAEGASAAEGGTGTAAEPAAETAGTADAAEQAETRAGNAPA